jgi:hypothetical protein
VTEGESADNAESGAPVFDAGRRSGSRGSDGLPAHIALEELETREPPAPEVPRRRWSDTEPDGAAAPPHLNFQVSQPPTTAFLIDDSTANAIAAAPVPAGGPQFLGRASSPVGASDRRKTRGARLPEVPPPGTRISAWSRSGPVVKPSSSNAGRMFRRVMWLVILACVGIGAFAGYPGVRDYIRERPVPAALHSYVSGRGVHYAPAGQGFTARLPKQPVRRDGALTATGSTPAMFVHRSIASGAGYEIVIRVVDVPDGMRFPFGAVGALADPRIGGGAPVNVRRVAFAGQSAYDYDLKSSASPPIHARVFLHGQRLYVMSVQSKSAETVLHTLATSFQYAT